MKLKEGIFTFASVVPNWSKIQTISDNGETFVQGFWAEICDNPVFITVKGIVWLPKTLRGKRPQDVTSHDFALLPPEDAAQTHYKDWIQTAKGSSARSKIWNGYAFTRQGRFGLQRLQKFFLKAHLNDVTRLGLDVKFSVNMQLFDVIEQTNNLTKVIRIGRALARKYKLIIELLKLDRKFRLVSRLEREFQPLWEKLNPLFTFDVTGYKPTFHENEEEEPEDIDIRELKKDFNQAAQPLMHPQMAEFIAAFEKFNHSEGDIKEEFDAMTSVLLSYIGRFGKHELGKSAQAILELPEYISLFHAIPRKTTN